jgi:hypothetical protein
LPGVGDVLDTVGDIGGDVRDGLGDAAGEVRDRAGDVVDEVRELPGEARDAAGDLVDNVEDGVEIVRDEVDERVRDAADRFFDLRESLSDRLLSSLNIEEKLERLEPGDTFTLAVNGEVSAELAGEVSGAIQVTQREDGTFVVTAEARVLVGLGVLDNNLLGGGSGEVEFEFDSLDEARQGIEGLVKAGTLTTPLGLATGPSPDEVGTLAGNISAVEVGGDVLGELDFRLGITDLQGGGVEGQVELTSGARIEFEDGEPTDIVATFEVTGEGAAELSNQIQGPLVFSEESAREFEEAVGFDPREGLGTVEAEASFEIEVRAPIIADPADGDPAEQADAIVADLGGIAIGPPTGSFRGNVEFESNNRGVEVGVAVEGIDQEGVRDFFDELGQGDLEGAIAGSGATITGSFNTFEDTGFDRELDASVFVVGAENTIREVDDRREVVIRPDPTGNELELSVEGDPALTAANGRGN